MTQRNRRMFWLLARAHRNVAAASDAKLADLGLTITQAGALFCFGEEGLLIGELGEALELAQSAASGLAKRLQDAGLVARSQVQGDGRAARLTLTTLGSQKRAEAARRAIAANARMLQGFSEREIEVIVRWLTQVANMSMPGKSSREK
jgi:MarR family transcriptional regulator, organic hydroperoxide resistance regulator